MDKLPNEIEIKAGTHMLDAPHPKAPVRYTTDKPVMVRVLAVEGQCYKVVDADGVVGYVGTVQRAWPPEPAPPQAPAFHRAMAQTFGARGGTALDPHYKAPPPTVDTTGLHPIAAQLVTALDDRPEVATALADQHRHAIATEIAREKGWKLPEPKKPDPPKVHPLVKLVTDGR